MSRPRLLIVDDEIEICELITDVARGQGFDTRTVSDPRQFENALQDFQPQALMMDLMMPGADALELLRSVGHLLRRKPVVLMSGQDSHTLQEYKKSAVAYGINVIDTKEKPIQVERLRQILGKLT
jgi:DNA-binding NtrC family response regulator